jgi:hypothetical protein
MNGRQWIRWASLCVPLAIVSIVAAQHQHARQTASQRLFVRVPPRVTVTAPRAAVLAHDLTSDPQVFPPQTWSVSSNVPGGVSVLFSTDRAFTSDADPSLRRDAVVELDVSASEGPGEWTILLSGSRTDYAAGEERALARAESRGAGRADLTLGVQFLGQPADELPPGTYSLTVTATVTANP